MPLSEDEQKLLEEIERNFYHNDPALARTVAQATRAPRNTRPVLAGVAALVGGLVLVVLGLSRHVAISYVGFVVMLGGAFLLEGHLRRFLRVGASSIAHRLLESAPKAPLRRPANERPERPPDRDNPDRP